MIPRKVHNLELPTSVRAGGEPLRVSLIDRGGETSTRSTLLALMYLQAHIQADSLTAKCLDEFKTHLESLLRSPRTRQVVEAIMAQATALGAIDADK